MSCVCSLQCGEFYLMVFVFNLYYFCHHPHDFEGHKSCRAESKEQVWGWSLAQFNSCTEFPRQEPQVLSPGKYHKAVGRNPISRVIKQSKIPGCFPGSWHGWAGRGSLESSWSSPCCSRVSQSLDPGPRVCLGWMKAHTHPAPEQSFGLSRNVSWKLVNIIHLLDGLDECEKETSNRKGEWKCFLNHLKVGGEKKKQQNFLVLFFSFSQFCRPPSSGRFSLLLKRSCL